MEERWDVITPTEDDHQGKIYSMATPLNDSEILILGGEDEISDIEIYSPANGSWERVNFNNRVIPEIKGT